MSQTLYLAQLHSYLRFEFAETVTQLACNDDNIKAFSSFEAAQSWASETQPISLNPFVGFYEEEIDFSLLLLAEDEDEKREEITADAMTAILNLLGLASPAVSAKPLSATLWHDWWEATAPQMTDAQKAAIWQFLVPMPYRIVEVEME